MALKRRIDPDAVARAKKPEPAPKKNLAKNRSYLERVWLNFREARGAEASDRRERNRDVALGLDLLPPDRTQRGRGSDLQERDRARRGPGQTFRVPESPETVKELRKAVASVTKKKACESVHLDDLF